MSGVKLENWEEPAAVKYGEGQKKWKEEKEGLTRTYTLTSVACYTAALCSLFIAWENMSRNPIFVAVSQGAILKTTHCWELSNIQIF